jgi:hypothetical protein
MALVDSLYWGAHRTSTPLAVHETGEFVPESIISEAGVMQYQSYPAVRDSLLRGFLYQDDMDPDADRWFTDAMCSNPRQSCIAPNFD